MNLYRITADYRPNNHNHPTYYVYGNSTKEARKRFENIITWLKVYAVDLLSITDKKEVETHWDKYIII